MCMLWGLNRDVNIVTYSVKFVTCLQSKVTTCIKEGDQCANHVTSLFNQKLKFMCARCLVKILL